ncbi:hypothetical protein ACFO5R_09510 [Halosolutus amylolyticus]|uniref:Uncharacterized protein n=1 Tax=Halosolutus amylolyticus TaxID=2932267 RepID=A0ABD5PNP1_9EURY|nr:hypothetical protein [Halosolutus amylolyticus]
MKRPSIVLWFLAVGIGVLHYLRHPPLLLVTGSLALVGWFFHVLVADLWFS